MWRGGDLPGVTHLISSEATVLSRRSTVTPQPLHSTAFLKCRLCSSLKSFQASERC